MKIAEKCKVFVAGALVAVLAAGMAMPALAVNATGYPSIAAMEQQNDINQEKVQAIKDAMARVNQTQYPNGNWTLESEYEDYELENKKSFVIPSIFLQSDGQELYFLVDFVSQDEESYYYWNKVDILYGEYDKFTRSMSYKIDYKVHNYSHEENIYKETLSLSGNSQDVDEMKRILSYETVYVRFNGAKVNGTQRTGTFLIDDETRQGITDIINLYYALMDATPEERTAALAG